MTSPDVTVVVATRDRPELLRRTLRSILEQDYPGQVSVTVVFDRAPLDDLADISVGSRRSLTTVSNIRTPGLAGARNTGITAADGELVAFCDDDDEWLPGKLAAQVALLTATPEASLIATGIEIVPADDSAVVRLPPAQATFDDFLRSRITEIHPSSFLFRRADLLGEIGLVDESLPASYGEDYDLILRAARIGSVVSVTEPLVRVHWNRVSFFSERWRGIADGLSYLLAKHPEFSDSAPGSARIEGQIAFAFAALGDRAAARHWARSALLHDRGQLRAWAALAVSLRLITPAFLVQQVNRHGRGL
jgi:glycosyltransferase involved in cell wall biosynthesis